MADEPLTIHGIRWREVFPFTNLFRAFRVAIHPSKLVLALTALLLLYLGGQLLDSVWRVADRAVPGEVAAFERFSAHPHAGRSFAAVRRSIRSDVEADYAAELVRLKLSPDTANALESARSSSKLDDVKAGLIRDRDDAVRAEKSVHDSAVAAVAKLKGDAAETARLNADREHDDAVRSIYAAASARYRSACRIKNQNLFDVFFDYESNQISNVVVGVRDWNWFGEESSADQSANPLGRESSTALMAPAGPGVVQSVTRFFTVGPVWLLTQHPLYFVLMGGYFLVLWSIFGGAISRIAAIHVARDEKLSIRSALVFSAGKLLSFFFAPLIPMFVILAVGLLVTAVSFAIGNIPGAGPILLGLSFVLALVAGFIMALVLLGLVGGFNLMYPTIAVEGSDSFDAISRSFSYLYARPWRLGFYTLVSIVYGAACYLFVRLFIYLILVITHRFVDLGIITSADSTAPLLSAMWPSPGTAARLTYDIDTLGLSTWQAIGARLIWLWVHMVIAVLGAFVVCFYFSANTIIYYLMRREVDATETDDVYLEQADDEFADPAPAAVGPVETPATTSPAAAVAAAEPASEITPPT